ncbi:MAG: hypothetical protein KDD33_13040 [Bdellovibrionales bacterium]|nr:hypothetical protein [Bdellovibrionales bacterium]
MSILEEKQVIEPSLVVKGIKKRGRKSRRHIFYFKKIDPQQVNVEKLKELCQKALKKYMRSVESAHLSLQPQTMTKHSNGYESFSFMMFTNEIIELEV